MQTQDFWKTSIDKLINEIDDYLKNHHHGPAIAAFDADGTCWFNDVGRDFYLYQCESIFKNKLTWEDYTKREKKSIEESLWWLAEINHQVNIEHLIQQAQQSLHKNPLQLIPSQKKLIEYLIQKGIQVYIVTASIKWSVVPAALALGIDQDHVLGVTTKIDSNNRLSLERQVPITWRDGKPKALLQATQGVAPFLCSGNTTSDLPLLKAATKFKISVNSAPEHESVHASESALKSVSLQNNWLHFDYLSKN